MNALLFLLLFCSTVVGFSQTNEPKSTFIMQLNGKEYKLTQGQEIELDGEFVNPKITLNLSEVKHFSNPVIAFDYPSNFSYEFEEDSEYKNWTFDGNTFVVMLFEMTTKTELKALTEEMAKQFGKKNCKIKPLSFDLGNNQLSGKKLTVTLAGQVLSIDLLELPSTDGKSHFMVFQDTKKSDRSASTQALNTLKIIDQSIEFTGRKTD